MPEVFISIPSAKNDAQAAVRRNIIGVVRSLGLSPRTVGSSADDTDFPSGPPFAHVIRIMKQCSGVLIVAYEKNTAGNFLANSASAEPLKKGRVVLATPWNHAEAGIGYSLGLPILILCEKQLYRDGLLENNVICYVQDFEYQDLSPLGAVLSGRINDWANAVRNYKPERASKTLDTTSLGDIVHFIAHSNWGSIVQLVVILAAIFGAGITLGALFPAFK